MKTKIISILLLTALACFGQGTISPTVDQRGFVGGTFTGSGAGLTNVLSTNYFGELRINDATLHGVILAGTTAIRFTNWNASTSFGCGINSAQGYITNTVAGIYRLSATLSFGASGLENYTVMISSNDVAISDTTRSTTIHDAGYIQTVPLYYTTYLPAGTRISIGAFSDVANQPSQMSFGNLSICRQ